MLESTSIDCLYDDGPVSETDTKIRECYPYGPFGRPLEFYYNVGWSMMVAEAIAGPPPEWISAMVGKLLDPLNYVDLPNPPEEGHGDVRYVEK